MRKVIAALVGATVVFIWSGLSWMVFPWHNWDIKTFKEEGKVVAEALKTQSDGHGLYMIPYCDPKTAKDPEKEKEWIAKAQQGPFAYMVVKPEGVKWDMKLALAVQFLIGLGVAFIAAILLGYCKATSLIGRAWFVTFAVTAGAVLVQLSNWNWWAFPTTATLVNIADVVIAWYLAGLFMAKIIK
ncbi:hypothetical protein [Candidatus Berkiella aquae]|uniref:Uncharacterized protein n=1 Tax=Candidatus Berkiella aquae TaxID=295108 RepID=A0A0Q9YWK2_9GAMM|nr:hypothetical protein [Candidatus Berkiella aquae]MCS5712208.1 hypothetical protein [Candidatus Berkiella aquae]